MADQDRNTNLEVDWVRDTPWWYPPREVVLGRDSIGAAAQSLMIGTEWPQWRLAFYQVGGTRKEDNRCKACDEDALGTLRHRHCVCPAYKQLRDNGLGIESRKELRAGVGNHGLEDVLDQEPTTLSEGLRAIFPNDWLPRLQESSVWALTSKP